MFFLLLLLCSLTYALHGSIHVPAGTDKMLDPTRVSLNLVGHGIYHFYKDGTFELPDLTPGRYSLVVQSMDFRIATGDTYTIVVKNETFYQVFEAHKPQPQLVPTGLDFPEQSVILRSFADHDPSSNFLNSLPLVPLIKQYPILGFVVVLVIALIGAPWVLSKFDPEFNDRFIEAQRQAKEVTKEE